MDTIEKIQEVQFKNNPYRNDENDRVLVILDTRNIMARLSQDYCNVSIDFTKLLTDTIRGRKCIAAIAVDSLITDVEGKDTARIFHKELRNSGFRTELIPPSNNKGKQDGVDVKIGLIAQKYVLSGNCDVVELITGDGDFTVLVKDLHEEGARVFITSYFRSLSYSLKDEADGVTILDDAPLIRMNPKNKMVGEVA